MQNINLLWFIFILGAVCITNYHVEANSNSAKVKNNFGIDEDVQNAAEEDANVSEEFEEFTEEEIDFFDEYLTYKGKDEDDGVYRIDDDMARKLDLGKDVLRDDKDAKKRNIPWEFVLYSPHQYVEKDLSWKDIEDLPVPPLPNEFVDHINSIKKMKDNMSMQELKGIELYEKGIAILNFSRDQKAEAYALLVGASSFGNMEAKILVAWAKLLGDTLKQNINEAKELFQELADEGYPEGNLGLGFLYSFGLGVNVSYSKSFAHYLVAASDNNEWAQMAVGYKYWSGLSIPNDCEQALDNYRKVADKVASGVQFSGGPLIRRIRIMEEVDSAPYSLGLVDNDLMEYYQLLADKGDVQSQVGLGHLHFQGGRGIARDPQKAYNYFYQAAQAGNPVAMAFLGRFYLEGNDVVKQNNDTAYMYFKKAADMGNPVGQSGLGMMYLHGKGVERDYRKALKYFTLAADQSWVDGQLQLGIMHYSGLGVKRDYKLAKNYFTYALQSGHVLAFYNLAQMHATGTGVMRSCETAVQLYKNVAERGKWGEKLLEAFMLYKKGKYKEAFVLYALLAELGYEIGQTNAAYILDTGDLGDNFFTRDEAYVRALMFWNRAASQGYSPAQVKIGDYFYYGQGVNVDYEMAALQYKLAFDQKRNAQAIFNLGYMHEQGIGMRQDMNLAKRCYDAAADANVDAVLPVALALMKLSVLVAFKYFQESQWHELFFLLNLDKSLGSNWDFYVMTLLIGLLGFVVYFRRPRQLLR